MLYNRWMFFPNISLKKKLHSDVVYYFNIFILLNKNYSVNKSIILYFYFYTIFKKIF